MRGETILDACASLDLPVESLESPACTHLRRGLDFLDQIEAAAPVNA